MPPQALIQRIRITIRGAVQGVGFRPFVYRLASDMGLPGWVINSPQGVCIEVEGAEAALEDFLFRLEKEKPPQARIQSLEFSLLDPISFQGFEIRYSHTEGSRNTLVLPDIATCRECLQEILDPADRRSRYPFTNCTHCGPRFSIIESLPYDRAGTSMKQFTMCADCREEYENPRNRRFHAQPNACPVCGPHLELWDEQGAVIARRDEALLAAAEKIRGGKIIAVKGIGGFHLMVDARNTDAIALLRQRKHREEKPFALMCATLESVKSECVVSALEERLLLSVESPIVLLTRREPSHLAPAVAPNNPCFGVMLPYSPLHHLLMRELAFPVVATSGNLSDEPICIDEREALHRLHDIADTYLVHDRPIVRHVDDSIVRVMLGRELVLRRARGYAPLPLHLKSAAPRLLAVGGHLKNSIAMTVEDNVFVSQHIGDLETPEALEAFRKVIASFRDIYPGEPLHVVADMHPDYLSTQFARGYGPPLLEVQHHYAHVASCMSENELEGTLLGVSWDGTGYGLDGTIWGGEFLLADETGFRRVATCRGFRLPGSGQAVKEPRRSALGVLYEIFGDKLFNMAGLQPLQSFSEMQQNVLRLMLEKSIHSPVTTSIGRLFDAVASITGLRQHANFEGQAAMELEFAIGNNLSQESYAVGWIEAETPENALWKEGVDRVNPVAPRTAEPQRLDKTIVFDWKATILEILDNIREGLPVGVISARFHNTLVSVIVEVAKRIGQERVVLTGGCFQNKYLTEHAVHRLRNEGFRPYWHQRIPPNDGGISLGQAFTASRLLRRST